jgi:putative transposase
VVLANADLNDKLRVVPVPPIRPVAVFSAFFTSFALSFHSRAALQLEILALRHQLRVLERVKRPKLTSSDRFLWVWLRRLWPD